MQTNSLNTNLMITHLKRKTIFFFDSIYNLFITKIETLRKYLNDNFKKEFILFFSSFADAFMMFVKKKNENLRLCVNYKNLNFHYYRKSLFHIVNKTIIKSFNKDCDFYKIKYSFCR